MKNLKQIIAFIFCISFFLGCSKERIVPILTRIDSIEKAQESYKNEIFLETKQAMEEPNVVSKLVDSAKLNIDTIVAADMEDIGNLQDIEDFGDAKLFFDGKFTEDFSGGGGGAGGGGGGGIFEPDNYIKSLLPLEIKFFKVYKISDMLLLKKHTMADQIRLQSEGMIYLSVKKNGVEVDINKLKPRIELSTRKPLKNASLYYEVKDKQFGYGQTWKFEEEIKSTSINKSGDTTFYVFSPKQYGWAQIGAPYDTLANKTSVKYISKIPKTSSLKIFAVYPKTKSILLADTSGLTPKLPIGEKYHSVVITKTADSKYFAFFELQNPNFNQSVDILLKRISQKALVSKLDSLK